MDIQSKIAELRKEFRALHEENDKKFKEAEERKENLSDADFELIAKNNLRLDAIERELSMLDAQAKRQDRMTAFDEPPLDARASQDDDPSPEQPQKPKFSMGEFYQHVARAADGGTESRTWLEKRAPTGVGIDGDAIGGYLVPDAPQRELLQAIVAGSDIASRCRNVPITVGNTAKWPAVNETSRVDGSRLGGIQTYWEGEGDTITASRPKFRLINLELKKLTALVYVTDEMLQDAPQTEAFVNSSLPQEFRTVLDNAILRGDGAGKPLGILESGVYATVLKESSGNGTGTLLFENVSKMLDRQLDVRGAIWLRNQATGHHLRAMKVGDTPIYLANMSATGTPQESLFGLPSFIVEQCSTTGTIGDVINANLSYYLLGQKGAIQTASSIHVQFLTVQTAFRFILRVDGQPQLNSAITPMNGTATLSAFVVTETRS